MIRTDGRPTIASAPRPPRDPERESRINVMTDVMMERVLQDQRWGEQNHPDGTCRYGDGGQAEAMKAYNAGAVRAGRLTWRDILAEEVCEAFAEDDPALLREELIQVAAVAVAWVQAIDRR